MFPNYVDNDDLDLLCKDRNVLRECVINQLGGYEENGYKIVEKKKQVRHHIDIIPSGTSELNKPYGVGNTLNFRFDLLDEPPYLQKFGHFTNKIQVKDNFFDFILDRKIQKEFEWPVMFKKQGTFKQGLEAIKVWCKSKGIPEEAAYPIFAKILGAGINPQPFLYPAWVKGKKDYQNNLERVLKSLSKKI